MERNEFLSALVCICVSLSAVSVITRYYSDSDVWNV